MSNLICYNFSVCFEKFCEWSWYFEVSYNLLYPEMLWDVDAGKVLFFFLLVHVDGRMIMIAVYYEDSCSIVDFL